MYYQHTTSNPHIPCEQCQAKQIIIDKYEQLTVLLRKKVKKNQQSRSSFSIATSQHGLTSLIQSHVNKAHSLMFTLQKIAVNKVVQAWMILKLNSSTDFPSLLGNGKVEKNSFERVISSELNCDKKKGAYQGLQSLQSIKTVVGLSLHTSIPKIKNRVNIQKDLSRKIFELKVQNGRLSDRIKQLQLQVEAGIRRQQKQVAKKRQSLQGLAEQLSQKNELIEQLKGNVKNLQAKLGAKEKGILNCMLEEDTESLRRVVFRLQNVNDKLNIDLDKLKKQKDSLTLKNKQLMQNNQDIQQKLKKLKQENFDLEQHKTGVNAAKKQLDIISCKLSTKMDRLRQLQKKLSDVNRGKSIIFPSSVLDNILDMKSDKKMVTQSTQTVTLQRSQSLRDVDAEHKIQSIFTYLFHIEDQNFTLQCLELFDEEEKQLLSSHKRKYVDIVNNHHHDASFDKIPITKKRFSDEFDCPFGDSVLQVFSEKHKDVTVESSIKLMEFEIERGKLIQKIGELKEMHMHIRCVILNFLRSLQFKCLKKESEGILAVLCDFFEYSQNERNQLQQVKTKKLFGFI